LNNEEKINRLEEFNLKINQYLTDKYEDKSKLKSKINYDVSIVQKLVIEAHCLKRVTIAPPPAVGGIIMENVNPFDMIFQNAWGRSFIPDIIDMVEQAIGKYKNNLVDNAEDIIKNKNFDKEYPSKITLKWLVNHVPIKLWLAGFGLFGGAFWLGVNFAPLFSK